jgi:amino acid transporter
MLNKLHELLVGSPLATIELKENRLNKVRALAAFSPDALSSIAYANQEIYLGLVVAGAAGLSQSFPIGLAIVGLLVIVALSYAQTIQGYPSGGGSYIVAKENLGTVPGLVAGGALMIDYVLTAAVSLTAGVEAIASAFPALWPYRVYASLVILLILTIANLRGLRDTGSLMAFPVYLFLGTYIPMLVYGAIRLAIEGPVPLTVTAPPPIQPLGLVLVLHAFAAGCTALTGIEAISNGTPTFEPPEPRNARITLGVMAVLMTILFVGSIGLTQFFGVVAGPNETILAALSSKILGNGFGFIVVQVATLLILSVAANTSFSGFPRVAAILAADKFFPRQYTNLGDRLVFSNGIIFLSGATALLIIVFGGDTHALVPLFAIGAFLAFTLSQAGMVRHWFRIKQRHWQLKAIINGVGALVTAVALLIIGTSKFLQGAWLSILMIPLLVVAFLQIRAHYRRVGEQLTLRGLPPSLRPLPKQRVVIPVSAVHRGIVDAVNFAESMSDNITALHIELVPGSGERVRAEWQSWWPDIPLVVIPSPYRSLVWPLIEFLDKTDEEHHDGQQAVLILSELVPAEWWQGFLHNQAAWLIRLAMIYRKRHTGFQRVIIEIPYHLKD